MAWFSRLRKKARALRRMVRVDFAQRDPAHLELQVDPKWRGSAAPNTHPPCVQNRAMGWALLGFVVAKMGTASAPSPADPPLCCFRIPLICPTLYWFRCIASPPSHGEGSFYVDQVSASSSTVGTLGVRRA